MFFKKKPKPDFVAIFNESEFCRVMNVANTIIKTESHEIAKETLHFMMGCIKRDMQHELIADFWYRYPAEPIKIEMFIPCSISDADCKSIYFTQEYKMVKLDASKTCTIVVPWKYEKITTSVHDVSEYGFYESSNQTGYYYDLMDLCYLDNGNHHTAAAIIKQISAPVIVRHYDVAKSFEYIRTDGTHWINQLTNKDIGLVTDFRIGILYELTRLYHNL